MRGIKVNVLFSLTSLPLTLPLIILSYRQLLASQNSGQAGGGLKRKRRDVHDLSISGDISEDEIQHRRRMRAALELALLDRFRAAEEGSEAMYDKAFDVLHRMETEPGGRVAVQVARLVEEALGWKRRADEGRLVDRFLRKLKVGMYDG